MKISNTVKYVLGDHIDTDLITPNKYLSDFTPSYLATVCFKETHPDFPETLRQGGIVTAGINFGCGSARESAPIAMKACGVQAIVAEEFARIFYRNAINIGLPCIACKGIAKAAQPGDELEIDFDTGEIKNVTRGVTLKGEPMPDELQKILSDGGLMEHLKKKLGLES